MNNPLATINPNDIESVEILKDAAATGICGSRGANGVIHHHQGQDRHELRVQPSAGYHPRLPAQHAQHGAIPDPRQEAKTMGHRLRGSGFTSAGDSPEPAGRLRAGLMTDTDWVNETVGMGVKHNYSFGARSGGDKHSLYAGVSYDDNGSVSSATVTSA